MKILFYGGKSHGRHSMNVIAEMLKRGHDVIVLKIDSKRNVGEEVDLKVFKGTNEHIVIDGRTVRIESMLPDSREIWVCNLKEDQKFTEISIRWVPNVTGLLLQMLISRAGRLFYEENLREDSFLKDRNLLVSKNEIKGLMESVGITNSEDSFIQFVTGQINSLKIENFESQELSVIDDSHQAQRLAAGLLPVDAQITQLFQDLGIDCVYTTRNCFGELFEECLTRGAKDSKLKTFYEIFSWDNLTTKSTILTEPDAYFVWNQTQLFELRAYHKAQAEIYVTGASRFENLYSSSKFSATKIPTSLSILWIGSSPLGCSDDFAIFERLVNFLEHSAPYSIQLIYRLHKDLEKEWGDEPPASSYESTSFQIQNSESDFLKALSSADLIFAVNTSAVFEAAVLGKSVYRPSFLMGNERNNRNFHENYMRRMTVDIHSKIDCERIVGEQVQGKMSKANSMRKILDFVAPNGTSRRPSEITLDWIEYIVEDAIN